MIISLSTSIMVLLAFTASASAHSCYECETEYYWDEEQLAADPCFKPELNSVKAVICPQPNSTLEKEGCLKIYTTMDSRHFDNHKHVPQRMVRKITRHCASFSRDVGDDCSETTGADSETMSCYCTEDKCNAAGHFEAGAKVALFVVAVTAFVKHYC